VIHSHVEGSPRLRVEQAVQAIDRHVTNLDPGERSPRYQLGGSGKQDVSRRRRLFALETSP
jgi:hypothetical protein